MSADSFLGALSGSPVMLADVHEVGAFDFRWPENVEHFERGWEFTAEAGGRRYRVKHGVGGREVYGRHRVHTVTWLDGHPMVEGVAADDYDQTGALLSRLKIDGRSHVQRTSDIPHGYEAFTVVVHRDDIVAKYSPRGLAVRIQEGDLEAWTRHAILRAASKTPKSAR